MPEPILELVFDSRRNALGFILGASLLVLHSVNQALRSLLITRDFLALAVIGRILPCWQLLAVCMLYSRRTVLAVFCLYK